MKNDNNTGIYFQFFMIVIIVSLTLVFLFLIIGAGLEFHRNVIICKDLGGEFVGSDNIEPGYIQCCKTNYSNHIRNDICEIVKVS